MPFEKLTEKLDAHLKWLAQGKGRKIDPADVGKIIAKLEKRRAELEDESARKPHKAERLAHKIAAADEMLARARWLQGQVESGS